MVITERPGGFQVNLRAWKSPLLISLAWIFIATWILIYKKVLNSRIALTLNAILFLGLLYLVFKTRGAAILIPLGFSIWFLCGKELITVNQNELSIRNDLFGVGRERHFQRPKVKNLRLSPTVFFDLYEGGHRWIGFGNIAFDYDENTYRFAYAMNGTESKELLEKVKSFWNKV